MTPEQLRAVAGRIRARHEPPVPTMTPGKYVSAEVLWAFAAALDEEADAEEQG